jgi:hypothetical protein
MVGHSQVDVLLARIEVSRDPGAAKDGALALTYRPDEPLEIRVLSAAGVRDNQAGSVSELKDRESLELGIIKKLELIPKHEPIFDPGIEGKEILIHGIPHLVVKGIPRQIGGAGEDPYRPAHFAELGRFQQAALLDLLVQYEGLHEDDLYERFEEEGIFAMSDGEFATYREEVLRSWGDTGE